MVCPTAALRRQDTVLRRLRLPRWQRKPLATSSTRPLLKLRLCHTTRRTLGTLEWPLPTHLSTAASHMQRNPIWRARRSIQRLQRERHILRCTDLKTRIRRLALTLMSVASQDQPQPLRQRQGVASSLAALPLLQRAAAAARRRLAAAARRRSASR
jgi:hypothetical protein